MFLGLVCQDLSSLVLESFNNQGMCSQFHFFCGISEIYVHVHSWLKDSIFMYEYDMFRLRFSEVLVLDDI